MERFEQEREREAAVDWRERAEPAPADFREDPRRGEHVQVREPAPEPQAPATKHRLEPAAAPAPRLAPHPQPQNGTGNSNRGRRPGFGFRFQWHPWWNFGAVTVTEVQAGSPAEECGIRVGDKILSFGGYSLVDWDGKLEAKGIHAGDVVDVVIRRRWFAEPETLRYALGVWATGARGRGPK